MGYQYPHTEGVVEPQVTDPDQTKNATKSGLMTEQKINPRPSCEGSWTNLFPIPLV